MKIPISVIKSGEYDCETIYLAYYLKSFTYDGANYVVTCLNWIANNLRLNPYRNGVDDIIETLMKMREDNIITISGRLDREDIERLEIRLLNHKIFDDSGECINPFSPMTFAGARYKEEERISLHMQALHYVVKSALKVTSDIYDIYDMVKRLDGGKSSDSVILETIMDEF